MMALSIKLVTWSCVFMPTLASSTNPNLVAMQALISFFQKMTPFHDSTVLCSPLPKSSSLLWHLLLSLNLLLSSSRPVRWFPTAKPSSTWGGPNPKAQFKWTTPQQQGLLTILLSLTGIRWWICASGGYIAAHHRISFDTTGMLDPKTGPTTTQNITLAPTMKRIESLMQVYGIGLAHETDLPPNHWP